MRNTQHHLTNSCQLSSKLFIILEQSRCCLHNGFERRESSAWRLMMYFSYRRALFGISISHTVLTQPRRALFTLSLPRKLMGWPSSQRTAMSNILSCEESKSDLNDLESVRGLHLGATMKNKEAFAACPSRA